MTHRDDTKPKRRLVYVAAIVGLLILVGVVVAVTVLLLQSNDESSVDNAAKQSEKSPQVEWIPSDQTPTALHVVPSTPTTSTPRMATPQPSIIVVPTSQPTTAAPSPSVSLPPIAVREAIIWLYPYSEPHVWTNSSSPQYKAAEWLATVDQHAVTKFPPNDPVRLLARYALVCMYFAVFPKNSNSTFFLNPNASVCNWGEGIQIRCSWPRGSNLERIQFGNMGLQGELPPQIGLMSHLKELGLPSNQLYGSFDFATRLGNLNWLGLQNNSYSGPLPSWWDQMSNLWILDLSMNQFTGPVPSNISGIPLKHLYLSDNALTGSIGFLNSLPEITYIRLEKNQFGGSLGDDFLASNVHQVATLRLDNNEFTGTIPSRILQSGRVNELRLFNNHFNGTISDIASTATAKLLNLANNNLTGTIPPSLANLWRLKHLDLSNNRLTKTIPSSLSRLQSLQTLYLEGNEDLSGTLPPSIMELPDLQALSVQSTGIEGTLPLTISNAPSLRLLNLGLAGLYGSLPPNVFGWRFQLEYLLLNCNSFVGSIPSLLADLSSLKVLRLDGNSFLVEGTSSSGANLEPLCQSDQHHQINVTIDCIDDIECSCCTKLCCLDIESCSGQGLPFVDSCKAQPFLRLGIEFDW